ncbi:sigma-E factor negative regulatory protein [Halomonas denitrificans]|uniref:sigma-E factor negative regulatory protein n=1 Tax=Halomonas TaxID=2745 RepID=UPI001A8D90AB|nr:MULTISPECIES: sigma-E factor negative regulatory protein [Halomonas]MED5296844.1 sigma-E factor negative regulatory protein [Pseudomonadota bacterium]MBN8410878.1 sigma-E factor negative regulatory protein [Halomonas litopenaei]MBY5930517.1 sigma-E factor negative regulatory protein [Halomonas sp. DP8Y7-3]MBY5969426.1 sigma-E factor negative regulatory protein [Halomonas denitrificans]MBY6030740.1 sigma-E factor negative regulatory protein [Halomonas sp. DP8Y7-1]
MSLNARESLSALMDNEGDELELRRVLKALDGDQDSAESWRRYHLMRSALRRETDTDPSVDLSAGIMARLEDEPAPLVESSPQGTAQRGGIGLARGAGIAAAVSLMVISGVQFYNSSFDAAPAAGTAGLAAGNGAAQPASVSNANAGAELASVAASRPSLMDLPMFQSGAGNGATNSGLMTVGAQVASPMMLSPSAQQSRVSDQAQAQLLQSYLDRHAQGAAFSSADNWMPMLRSTPVEAR